jgi:hypothetical protein
MGCTRRPERNCRFTFSVVSGRDMVPAIFGLHNEQCSPETDGLNVAPCRKGGLYWWRGSSVLLRTDYVLYTEKKIT